nr:hypothetical protein B0A51_11058 [Rachicladosporium sp. CCFEE 5018]
MSRASRGYGDVDTHEDFSLADGHGGYRLRDYIASIGNAAYSHDDYLEFTALRASNSRYAFKAHIDMTGATEEPWRNRIRAANAAYRRTAISQIVTSRTTCRETVACMLRKLPEELIITVMQQGVDAFCPRIVLSDTKPLPLPIMLQEAVSSLFAITKPPPTSLTQHATDSILARSTFCLRMITMKEHCPVPPLMPDSAYANVRHLHLAVHLPDTAYIQNRECYPTELYQCTRAMACLATWTPKLQSCCLEIRGLDPHNSEAGWTSLLGRTCRKGVGGRSTYAVEVATLVTEFSREAPGLVKKVKMVLGNADDGAIVDVSRVLSRGSAETMVDVAQRLVRAASGVVD